MSERFFELIIAFATGVIMLMALLIIFNKYMRIDTI